MLFKKTSDLLLPRVRFSLQLRLVLIVDAARLQEVHCLQAGGIEALFHAEIDICALLQQLLSNAYVTDDHRQLQRRAAEAVAYFVRIGTSSSAASTA